MTRLNSRIGDEIIYNTSSSDEEDLDEDNREVNTLHYQRDGQFADRYFYIADVIIFRNTYIIICIFIITLINEQFNFRMLVIDTILIAN